MNSPLELRLKELEAKIKELESKISNFCAKCQKEIKTEGTNGNWYLKDGGKEYEELKWELSKYYALIADLKLAKTMNWKIRKEEEKNTN